MWKLVLYLMKRHGVTRAMLHGIYESVTTASSCLKGKLPLGLIFAALNTLLIFNNLVPPNTT